MTPKSILRQIKVIKSVTKEMSSSKEAAIEFLRKIGITDESPKKTKDDHKK